MYIILINDEFRDLKFSNLNLIQLNMINIKKKFCSSTHI